MFRPYVFSHWDDLHDVLLEKGRSTNRLDHQSRLTQSQSCAHFGFQMLDMCTKNHPSCVNSTFQLSNCFFQLIVGFWILESCKFMGHWRSKPVLFDPNSRWVRLATWLRSSWCARPTRRRTPLRWAWSCSSNKTSGDGIMTLQWAFFILLGGSQ